MEGDNRQGAMLKVLAATVLLASGSVWAGSLPSEYVAIEVNQSTEQNLFQLLGQSKRQTIPFSHYEQGYCYRDKNAFVVFGGSPTITRISLHNTNPGLECSPSQSMLPRCLGDLCLGDSKQQSEAVLGEVLEPAEDDSSVFMFGETWQRPLSSEEKSRLNLPDDIKWADMTHNIWIRYTNQKAVEIGVYKFGTY